MSEKSENEDKGEAKDGKRKRHAEAEAAATPAWKDADYDGPLDAEQAAWRNKHLTHARLHTKPAAGGATK